MKKLKWFHAFKQLDLQTHILYPGPLSLPELKWSLEYPSIYASCNTSFSFIEGWCLFPSVFGQKAGCTLERMSVHLRATQRHTTIPTPTSKGNLESPINQAFMFLDCWMKPRVPRENPHMHGRTCKLHATRESNLGEQCYKHWKVFSEGKKIYWKVVVDVKFTEIFTYILPSCP